MMWILAALLGYDLSNHQILDKLHELLSLWSINETNKNKKAKPPSKMISNKSSSQTCCTENSPTSTQQLITNIIQTLSNQLRQQQSNKRQYKMTSRETLNVFNSLFLIDIFIYLLH